MNKFFLSIFMFFLFFSTAFSSDFGIRFGEIKIIEHVSGGGLRFGFVKEESRVPLLTAFDGVYYGLEYTPPDNEEHLVEIRAIFPAGVESSGPDISSVRKKQNYEELVLKPEKVQGKMVRPLPFDKGDKPGIYRLKINVDGSLYKEIKYEAFLPEKHN